MYIWNRYFGKKNDAPKVITSTSDPQRVEDDWVIVAEDELELNRELLQSIVFESTLPHVNTSITTRELNFNPQTQEEIKLESTTIFEQQNRSSSNPPSIPPSDSQNAELLAPQSRTLRDLTHDSSIDRKLNALHLVTRSHLREQTRRKHRMIQHVKPAKPTKRTMPRYYPRERRVNRKY
jgi:hypothetical protein